MKPGILLAAALALSVTGVGTSCSRSETPATTVSAAPEAVYTVRGRIVTLPDPAKPASEFRVEHEAIDNFVGIDGKLGMNSMTMGFPLAKGVSLEGLSVGDKVELTFEVRWKSQPRSQTTKVVKLPPETELHFGKAKGR